VAALRADRAPSEALRQSALRAVRRARPPEAALTPLPRTRASNSATVNARFGLVFLPPLWAMGKSLLGLPSIQQLMRPYSRNVCGLSRSCSGAAPNGERHSL
jgi:hypothetical protein